MADIEGQRALDLSDRRILRILQQDGRTTWAQLAEDVGLSAPTVTDRVRRLERDGIIRGFAARVAPDPVGLPTLAFVAVSIRDAREHEAFLELARAVPEVQECHIVAGAYDYLLKVRCAGPDDLASLIRERVRTLPGVARTNTTMVLESVKETGELPLAEE